MIRCVVVSNLQSSTEPLTHQFDVALLDLDGVVYIGADAVSGAAAALAEARKQGMRLAFVTNNAARPPNVVAEHLTGIGVPAEPAEVITSAQAAAHYLADLVPPGSAVLVVGTVGLDEALTERGLRPVHSASDDVVAVVQGYSPDLDWRQLAEGAVAIRRGLPWVATNLDPTVPSARGPLPGNGALVAALRLATGVDPVATGKPDPTMHRESVQRAEAKRPIVVGDRLDTDVEGANAVGCASLLVLSGVTTARELLAAPARLRPSYIARDVGGLLYAHAAPDLDETTATCGDWRARAGSGGELTLSRSGGEGSDGGGDDSGEARTTRRDPQPRSTLGDDLDPLRALCAAAWQRTSERDGEAATPRCRADGEAAERVLASLELS